MSRSRLVFFAIIGVALLFVAATVVVPSIFKPIADTQATAQTSQNTTQITVVYGTEKEQWFQDAIAKFQTVNPNIKITAVGQGSMDAYRSLSQITQGGTTLANGKAIPTLWSPAATIQVNLLNGSNQLGRPLAISCKRLVLSPLVIMTWTNRANVFNAFYKDKGGISFDNLYDALNPAGSIRGKWANIGDAALWKTLGLPSDDNNPASWGLLKLGHTNPQDSNSGVMMLVAMANNYYKQTQVVTAQNVTDDKFASWLQTIESGVTTPLISSTGLFTNDVIVKGPASYDFVVAYEALAIENYKNAIGRQGQGLQITYPPFNLYSDHPMCLIDHPSITQKQRDAAQKFQDFLLTPDIQKLALQYGFRPADPNIPIFGANSGFDDPALKAAGLSAQIGQEIQIPDAATIQNLLTIWQRSFRNP